MAVVMRRAQIGGVHKSMTIAAGKRSASTVAEWRRVEIVLVHSTMIIVRGKRAPLVATARVWVRIISIAGTAMAMVRMTIRIVSVVGTAMMRIGGRVGSSAVVRAVRMVIPFPGTIIVSVVIVISVRVPIKVIVDWGKVVLVGPNRSRS